MHEHMEQWLFVTQWFLIGLACALALLTIIGIAILFQVRDSKSRIIRLQTSNTETQALLGLVKSYLIEVRKEGAKMANGIKPEVVETKEAVTDKIMPALEVTKQNGQKMSLGEYVQSNTHELRDELQKVVSKLNVLEVRMDKEMKT